MQTPNYIFAESACKSTYIHSLLLWPPSRQKWRHPTFPPNNPVLPNSAVSARPNCHNVLEKNVLEKNVAKKPIGWGLFAVAWRTG